MLSLALIFSLFTTNLKAEETLEDMPSDLKPYVEFVWEKIMSPSSSDAPNGEGSYIKQNLILDQIYRNNGSINYCVRWQSSRQITLQERQAFAVLLSEIINDWAKHLIGYDGWPFNEIDVKIVAWATSDASLILDKQDNEVVYTSYSHDGLSDSDAAIPAKLPNAPDECSSELHYTNKNYDYGDCRFDMYAWVTDGWGFGGVGGDWGQRTSYDQWIGMRHMILHEVGHGLSLPDFYEEWKTPDLGSGIFGSTIKSIMIAGNSTVITDWDKWKIGRAHV